MGYDVTEIRFDELMLEVERGFFSGYLTGAAQIDADGCVVSMSLDGFEHGQQVTKHYDVPSRYTENVTRNGSLLRLIAAAVEKQCQGSIQDALADWHEARAVREFEPAE